MQDLISRQPETHDKRTETHACDLISRNAALALVVKAIHGTDSEEIKDYLFGGLRKELWALPSAKPEIIRCKDCKYQDEEYRNTSTKWLPCMDVQTDSNWYCGSAERGRQ